MHVAHAAWGPDRRLHLWAEDGAAWLDDSDDASEPTRRKRRPEIDSDARPHPFAAAAFELPTVLSGTWPIEATGDGLAVALPTAGERPLPSPALALDSGTPDGVRIEPWVVPTAPQDARGMLAVALALPQRPTPGLSAGIRFFGRVTLFALELVARGRFLPELDSESRVAWRPVPGGGDLARLAALAGSMPDDCLAARADLASDPGGPTILLDEYVGEIVNAVVADVVRDMHVPRTAPPALHAILGGGLMRPGAPEPAVLVEALDRWRAAVAPPGGPFRTLFRLREPGRPRSTARAPGAPGDAGDAVTERSDGGVQPEALDAPPEEAWRLEILAGARDDPSVLLSASQLWADSSALRSFAPDDPEEAVLVDLARATRLYPPLEPVLQRAVPDALELDTESAHRFLRDGAPLLTDAGYAVLLPAWWSQRRRRLGLRLHARPRRSARRAGADALFGRDALVDYDWRVAVGDASLTEAELESLARVKSGLVWIRGEWVEVAPGDVEAALTAIASTAGGGARPPLTVADVLRLALGTGRAPEGLEVDGVDAEGWLAPLLAGDAPLGADAIATPARFGATLRPYQERGLGWLAALDRLGFGGILADDMGLGKTAQLLALLVAEQSNVPAAERIGPTLVICPMSLVGNWQREAERFAPTLRGHVHHGTRRLSADDLREAVAGADLVITTYALAARDRRALASITWGRVVLDEAQEIKNSDTDQSRAARSLRAPSRFALTGTPVENRLTELWTIMDFCNPGLLGPESAFVNRFAIPIERFRDETAAERLRRVVSPFILRRVKTDPTIVPELPRKLEFAVSCSLTREQATLYQAVVDELMPDLERAADQEDYRGRVLRAILRLKQVCNHPAQFLGDGSPLRGRSGKLERLEEVLDSVLSGRERALVFTQFTEWAERLVPYLRDRFGREVLYLHGGVPRQARDAMVERFATGSVPIFVLSLKAGGKGLNLVAANHVIHYDRWWNPAVEDQASDRAYRIGQTREVEVRTFVAAGTLEEKIAGMLAAKRDLAERIVRSGERSFTELSPTELREIIALSSTAVVEP